MHMATNEKDTKKKKAFILGEEEQNSNKVSFFSSSTLDKLYMGKRRLTDSKVNYNSPSIK